MKRLLFIGLTAIGLACQLSAQVTLHQLDGKISVAIGGKPFTEIFFGPETRKPYLYPLRSAVGTVVTRQYPMISADAAKALGETIDHPHHQGLTFTFAEVNGYNFWASDSSQLDNKSGRIRLRRVLEVKSGAEQGTARMAFDWLDPAGKVILTEDRTMVFRGSATERILDFDVRLKAVTPIKFGDTKEGMFNLRLASGLEEPAPKSPATPKRTGLMTSSAGCRTEKECWGKRADWMDISGQVEGESLGVAIFDHPENPRHPTYWHARAYGLFAANPFGVRDFTGDRAADGSMSLKPGETLRFRYRVVIHPGDATAANLTPAYQHWAAATR